MLKSFVLMTLVAVAGQASPDFDKSAYAPEELAVGTIRSIMSAQAVYRQTHPDAGYACDIETLVAADTLVDAMADGKDFDGYVYRVWCEEKTVPQAAFRASAVPSKKQKGSTLTVCADESSRPPRTTAGDVAECFSRNRATGQ